jgi:hypothetical protein
VDQAEIGSYVNLEVLLLGMTYSSRSERSMIRKHRAPAYVERAVEASDATTFRFCPLAGAKSVEILEHLLPNAFLAAALTSSSKSNFAKSTSFKR